MRVMADTFVKFGLIVVIILLVAILGVMTGFVTIPITETTTTTFVSVGPVVRFATIYCNSSGVITIIVMNQGDSDLFTSSLIWSKNDVIQSGVTCNTGVIKPRDRGNCTIAGNTAGENYNILAAIPESEYWRDASEIVSC